MNYKIPFLILVFIICYKGTLATSTNGNEFKKLSQHKSEIQQLKLSNELENEAQNVNDSSKLQILLNRTQKNSLQSVSLDRNSNMSSQVNNTSLYNKTQRNNTNFTQPNNQNEPYPNNMNNSSTYNSNSTQNNSQNNNSIIQNQPNKTQSKSNQTQDSNYSDQNYEMNSKPQLNFTTSKIHMKLRKLPQKIINSFDITYYNQSNQQFETIVIYDNQTQFNHQTKDGKYYYYKNDEQIYLTKEFDQNGNIIFRNLTYNFQLGITDDLIFSNNQKNLHYFGTIILTPGFNIDSSISNEYSFITLNTESNYNYEYRSFYNNSYYDLEYNNGTSDINYNNKLFDLQIQTDSQQINENEITQSQNTHQETSNTQFEKKKDNPNNQQEITKQSTTNITNAFSESHIMIINGDTQLVESHQVQEDNNNQQSYQQLQQDNYTSSSGQQSNYDQLYQEDVEQFIYGDQMDAEVNTNTFTKQNTSSFIQYNTEAEQQINQKSYQNSTVTNTKLEIHQNFTTDSQNSETQSITQLNNNELNITINNSSSPIWSQSNNSTFILNKSDGNQNMLQIDEYLQSGNENTEDKKQRTATITKKNINNDTTTSKQINLSLRGSKKMATGAWEQIEVSTLQNSNSNIIEEAIQAVNEKFNPQQDGFEYKQIIQAQQQLVSGFNYQLQLNYANKLEESRIYQTIIYSVPWANKPDQIIQCERVDQQQI